MAVDKNIDWNPPPQLTQAKTSSCGSFYIRNPLLFPGTLVYM